MASPVNAVLCAAVAAAFWSLLGYAVTRHVFARVLAIGAAPVVGWAVFSAATLPLFILIGFYWPAVIAVAASAAAVAAASLRAAPAIDKSPGPGRIPALSYVAAALLALAPAAAILPKYSTDGVHLAPPIFDHAKIAIIDAMTRQGLPPVDPVYGAAGPHGQFFYYYLWHYSAADFALLLHITGWEADIALTWFTAFASLSLAMALAVWLCKRPGAAICVVLLAAATSLRATLAWLFGTDGLEPFLQTSTGFAGWLFQAAWAPQHLMSASCVVTAMLLIAGCAQRRTVLCLLTLVLVVVAGFESSTYVGGITFAVAALACAPIVLASIDPPQRIRFIGAMAITAVLVLALAAPFIANQLAAMSVRSSSGPIGFHHFEVLGALVPDNVRRALDWPAYWLVLLPIEFPATYVAGATALFVLPQSGLARQERLAVLLCGTLVAAGLLIGWLLVSTVGDNNDLALRAVLPAALVMIAATAAGVMLAPRRFAIMAAAVIGLVLSLPDAFAMIRSNVAGITAAEADVFARSPEMWVAVRRYASPTARVANNPMFLQDLTYWPANISWALLADRSSCFAGRELVLALAAISDQRREAANAQFIRVFDGQGNAQDVADLAHKYDCDVVVVVPQDGAWSGDPFSASADYRLAESREGRWRIYVKSPRTN
jgi:hypothetical protein